MSQQNIELDIRPSAEEPKAEEILQELKERNPAEAARVESPLLEDEAGTSRQRTSDASTSEEETSAGQRLVEQLLVLASDEDEPLAAPSWKEVFAGGGLVALIRHNWKLLLLVISMVVFYVALGYFTRDKLIENDELSRELLDRRYKALILSSELRERTLRSKIEEQLSDTTLHTTTDRPFQLPVEREE